MKVVHIAHEMVHIVHIPCWSVLNVIAISTNEEIQDKPKNKKIYSLLKHSWLTSIGIGTL